MIDMPIEQELIEEIRKLDTDQQRQALTYVRSLTRPKGISGKLAVQYAHEIGFSHESLAEMEKAINEMKEQIDDFPEVNFDE